MESEDAILALAALAQPTRLDVFRLLVKREPEGMAAGDIAKALAVPQNTMSAHLAILSRAGLVRRQTREPLDHLSRGSHALPGRDAVHAQGLLRRTPRDLRAAGRKPHAVLSAEIKEQGRCLNASTMFCSCAPATPRGRSSRKSILRKEGRGRFRSFSAGSQPKGRVNPLAIKVLASMDYPTDDLRSKSWEEFASADAPKMDFVFTVCDNAAQETCPVWPGQPMSAHWGIEDPAEVVGTDLEKEAAFVTAFRLLRNRIAVFTSLPLASIDRLSLGARLREIGRSEGAASSRSDVA